MLKVIRMKAMQGRGSRRVSGCGGGQMLERGEDSTGFGGELTEVFEEDLWIRGTRVEIVE